MADYASFRGHSAPFFLLEMDFEPGAECTGAQVILAGFGEATVEVASLTRPDGESGLPLPSLFSPAASGTLVIPLHPDPDTVPEGRWSLQVIGNEEAPVAGWLVERIAPVSENPGVRINVVALHRGWTSSESLERFLEPVLVEVQDVLGGPSGFGIEVTGFDVVSDPAALDAWSVMDGVGGISSDMDSLFAYYATAQRVIPVFLVEEIRRSDGKGATSMWSPSIPGPAFAGTPERSGMLIQIPGEEEPPAEDLDIRIAHSLAHFLGLPHTTEANGSALMSPPFGEVGTDGLESTPACSDEQDLDEDGFLVWTECKDADGQNLMFWSPQPQSRALTEEQRALLLHHPMVE